MGRVTICLDRKEHRVSHKPGPGARDRLQVRTEFNAETRRQYTQQPVQYYYPAGGAPGPLYTYLIN